MNNPLEQLNDIHLPPDASIWPLAIGWWLVIAAATLLLIALIVFSSRYIQRRKSQKAALQALAAIRSTDPDWLNQMNSVLKRAALSYFAAEQVAALHSEQWLAFLVQQLPKGRQQKFKQQYQPVLLGAFVVDANLAFAPTIEQAKNWLKYALPPVKSRMKNKDLTEANNV
ncbi:DUF4381 domain-containing protein [Aliiglaciecola sp. LCG003]|uniref:DUF4381 domain-containing protein n=1 Tax=Aliiglaciecola sp. LCG003 TaxID=3053655 RepID=UPI002573FEB6|nr:DUF4381 domain-containing protein [Aliiglaciecola sp. LCG003]WJG10628.1 DUF4381 domain-containing protein [Aliiglaciecola sp. LCG003]